jgi:hypothetical protein
MLGQCQGGTHHRGLIEPSFSNKVDDISFFELFEREQNFF